MAMSYAPTPIHPYSQSPQLPQAYYSSTPPAPPPKPSATGTPNPNQGPPLPPPPPSQYQNEPSELDGGQTYPPQYHRSQPDLPPSHAETHPSRAYSSQAREPDLPPIEPGWLPETLKEKNTADLHALLNDPELQSALLANPETQHPSLPQSERALTQLVNQNLQLASNLQTLESRLASNRQETQSRLLSLRALEQSHRSKISETETALAQFSPMALYQRLSASVQEQESLVRGMEESWLEEGGRADEREVGEFVRRVREARRTGFLREERRGRWDEGRVGGWR